MTINIHCSDDFWNTSHAFIDHLKKERNSSDNTVISYKTGLNMFNNYLHCHHGIAFDEMCFAHYSLDNIRAFLKRNLYELELAPRTCNARTSAIKMLLEYAAADGDADFMCLYNAAKRINKVKEPETPIEYYTEAQMSAILNAFNINTKTGRRNLAMFSLYYATGARISEIVALKVKDLRLDVEAPYVTIFAKGRRYNEVPILDKNAISILKRYMEEFHPYRNRERPLFYAWTHNVMHELSTDTVSTALKNAVEVARESGVSMPERNHCHMIRKTRGMDLYNNGVPLPYVQQMLGHKDASTTSGFYVFATKITLTKELRKIDDEDLTKVKMWKDDPDMDKYKL